MQEDYRELIQEWFGDCRNTQEVAELYADIKMENQKQMELGIKVFVIQED